MSTKKRNKATQAGAADTKDVVMEQTAGKQPLSSPLVQRERPPTIEVIVRVSKEETLPGQTVVAGNYVTPRIDDRGKQHGGDDILVMMNGTSRKVDEEIDISGKVRVHTVNGRNGTMPDEFLGVQILGFMETIGKDFATNKEQLPIPEGITILGLIQIIHEKEQIVVDERQQQLLSALAKSDLGKVRLDIRKYFHPLPRA